MNVIIRNRKQYKRSAAIWWRCACGCTYGTVRADAMDVCDDAVTRISETSDCRADLCTAMWSDDKGTLHQCILRADHDGQHRMWAQGWRGGLTTREFQ